MLTRVLRILALEAVVFFGLAVYCYGPLDARPAESDKCPVCGMFVAKYPEWVGQVRFGDGTAVFFDGAKDLFKYLHDIEEYHPDRSLDDIELVLVTDYYTLAPIDARLASFVVGSNVIGPMGAELAAFESHDAAREFLVDHQGRQILMYGQISEAVIGRLD